MRMLCLHSSIQGYEKARGERDVAAQVRRHKNFIWEDVSSLNDFPFTAEIS